LLLRPSAPGHLILVQEASAEPWMLMSETEAKLVDQVVPADDIGGGGQLALLSSLIHPALWATRIPDEPGGRPGSAAE
jgi:hypothetical protein